MSRSRHFGRLLFYVVSDPGGLQILRISKMKMPMTIRPAHPAGHEALCALFQELDEVHHRVRPDIFRPPTGAPRTQAFLEATIAGPQSTILVAANAQDQLFGLATLFAHTVAATIVRDERRFVELDNLVVTAQVRRHGVGRLLVQGAIDWTKGKGGGARPKRLVFQCAGQGFLQGAGV